MSSVGSITVLSLFAAVISAQAADTMKAFPPAEEGMVRFVLQVPKQDDESLFKMELIVGKTVQVDEKNRYFFGGRVESNAKRKTNRSQRYRVLSSTHRVAAGCLD